MSRFALGTILLTVDAAVPRVLPLVLKWPPPTPTEVYDVIVALNPIVTQVLTTFFAVWLQWILTFLTMSYAWNDRVWSVLPPLWAVLYAVHPVISQDNKTSGQWDVRMSVMAALVVAWGLRLTFNGARRNVFSCKSPLFLRLSVCTSVLKSDFPMRLTAALALELCRGT